MAGNIVDERFNKISLSNIVYRNKLDGLLKKTGQATSYHTGDDGDLELGIAHRYTILTTGQYAGTTNITINGKTNAAGNACVQDEVSGEMFHRAVIQADIGPAADGKLFWDQWALAAESCTFATAADTITAAAGTPFNTSALCAGRKITISGTTHNDGVVTVTNITTTVITVSENLIDEGPVNTTFATKGDLIWDLRDQANANSLAGYTDWRIPNRKELESIFNMGQASPSINGTIFPSTPANNRWTSSTVHSDTFSAWYAYFDVGYIYYSSKNSNKYHVRLVR